MLWRRHHPQTQAPRKTKRRQEAHEAHRPSRHSPRGVFGGAESGRGGVGGSLRTLCFTDNSSQVAIRMDVLVRVTIAALLVLTGTAYVGRTHKLFELASHFRLQYLLAAFACVAISLTL